MERIVLESAAVSSSLLCNQPIFTDSSVRLNTPELYQKISASDHRAINTKLEEVETDLKGNSKNEPCKTRPTTTGSSEVLSRIEAVFESVIDSLLQKQQKISIPIKVKRQPPKPILGSSESVSFTPSWTRVLVNFPGGETREASRFSTFRLGAYSQSSSRI